MTEQVYIPLEQIKPNPYQPRTVEDVAAIAEIAVNIYRNGLMQVPSARRVNGHYELVFGHTRMAAYKMLAETGVPAADIQPDANFASMPINLHQLNDRQMFEMAVAENIKRRDLNPIEQAQAMKRYMAEFEATSKQAAELFGVNDATVRGKVRLLDLPDEVKAKLSAGTISEGTARDILSLQKVASPDVVQQTVEQIEKGVNDFGQAVLPKEIIEDKIDELDNVQQLTWANDDKKPKTKGGWMLDMKNFPNQYLPVLSGHVAVQALDCFNDKPAQKLVLEIAEYLDASTAKDAGKEYYEANQSQIEKRMKALEEINPAYSQRLQHLINPPACNTCPSMTKFSDRHYCGIKACYERKVSAWKRHSMHAESKKLGVSILNPEVDGNYLVLEDTYRNQEHAELWRKKNKDLRLAFMEDIDRKKFQSGYDDCPDGCVVVVVGKTLEKLAEKKEQVREEKRFDVDEFREELMEKRVNELLWDATAYLKSIMDGMPDEAVISLYDAPRFGWSDHSAIPDPEFTNDTKNSIIAEHTRREFAFWMLVSGDDGVSDDADAYQTLADLVKAIQERAKTWKVKLPAELTKRAAQYDAEIADAVSAETKARKKK
jgi:ParB/RepB/Spo0J family partition protein